MEITILTGIILGVIEGLTEFAPISSTAHILISGKALAIAPSVFFTAFTISIQSGAILAAVVFFWKTVIKNLSLIPKVIIGFIPTAIVGLLVHSYISTLFEQTWIIAVMLIIGGIVFLFLKPNDSPVELVSISYKEAFLIGCSQTLALIPGVSRSGATLIGGTTLKIPRAHIVAFSFLLGIPTILGASIFELRSIPPLSESQWFLILVGAIVAFITALLTIKWFIALLTKKPLSWFGWYRIILGIIILLFVI